MLIFLLLLAIALDITAIADVLTLKRHTDTEKKLLWIITICLLPFIGIMLYVLVSRRS